MKSMNRDKNKSTEISFSKNIILGDIEAGNNLQIGDTTTINNYYEIDSYQEKSNIPTSKIKQQFQQASFHLYEYKNYFGNLQATHINRKETDILFNWIIKQSSPKGYPLRILTGNAGSGKSVILKDLLTKLIASQIPVIGIKADRYYVESIKELENKIDIRDEMIKMIHSLLDENKTVVVIIDQLDALSLSLSAQKYISTYQILISKLKKIKGVKIILSIREFDLIYDEQFKSLLNINKAFRAENIKITVGILSKTQIKTVLKQFEIEHVKLSPTLVELLQIPLHLNVFCEIYEPTLNFDTFKTLQDLYEKLWDQKIRKINNEIAASKQQCIDFLFKIASHNKTSISSIPYLDQYSEEIRYCESSGIINIESNQIQFFHQTFLDFVFAKYFVNENISIKDFLIENAQSLKIRAKLKMIINYLKVYDEDSYIKFLSELLLDPAIRFHIKHLLITIIGFTDKPTNKEINLVFEEVLKNESIKREFLINAVGKKWIELFIEKGTLNELISENTKPSTTSNPSHQLWLHLLARGLPRNRNLTLTYLSSLPTYKHLGKEIGLYLVNLKKWDNPLAFKLYERYKEFIEQDIHIYYKILEDISKYDIIWTIENYRLYVLKTWDKTLEIDSKDSFGILDVQLMKFLFQEYPKKAFDLYLDLLKTLIYKTKLSVENKILFEDTAYIFYQEGNHNTRVSEDLLQQIRQYVRQMAETGDAIFRSFVTEYRNTNSITLLKVLVEGFLSKPIGYIDHIYEFLVILEKKETFNKRGNLQHSIRQLLKQVYPYFSKSQKNRINQLILVIAPKNEVYSQFDTDGGKKIYQYRGELMFKYLRTLPEKELATNIRLKKKYLELNRRFGNIQDKPSFQFSGIRAVPAPLPNTAYEHMSFKEWRNSFRIYGEDYKRDLFSDKGSKDQHIDKFKHHARSKPNKFYPFIKELVQENIVESIYIIKGIEGLTNADFDTTKILELLEETFELNLNLLAVHCQIRISEYLLKRKVYSNQLINYIIKIALSHEDPSDDNLPSLPDTIKTVKDPRQYGINTIRGYAVDLLCKTHSIGLEDIILKTLEEISEKDIVKVKICMIPYLPSFINIDKNRTLNIFLKLAQSDNEYILKYLMRPAQYLAQTNFSELLPYFEKAITYKSIQAEVSIIIAIGWLNEKKDSFELLKKAWNLSEKSKTKMPLVAAHNLYLEDGTLNPKSEHLFKCFLYGASHQTQISYLGFFEKVTIKDFINIYPLILEYAKSKVSKVHFSSYYEYLIKCADVYLYECLDLLFHFDNFNDPNIAGIGYYDMEPINLLIKCYGQLDKESAKDKEYIIKSMDFLDKLLKSSRFKNQTLKVIKDFEEDTKLITKNTSYGIERTR